MKRILSLLLKRMVFFWTQWTFNILLCNKNVLCFCCYVPLLQIIFTINNPINYILWFLPQYVIHTWVTVVVPWLLLDIQTTTNFGALLCICAFCWVTLVWLSLTCCCCDCCCCCCWGCCWIALVLIFVVVGVWDRDCKITNFCPPAVVVPPAVLLVPSIIVRPVCCPGLELVTK